MKKFTKHLQHYLPLISILVAGLVGILVFSYDIEFQFVILLATAFGYVSWGIVHHFIHKDLHLSVILEYVVIAFLGVVLATSLLIRA